MAIYELDPAARRATGIIIPAPAASHVGDDERARRSLTLAVDDNDDDTASLQSWVDVRLSTNSGAKADIC